MMGLKGPGNDDTCSSLVCCPPVHVSCLSLFRFSSLQYPSRLYQNFEIQISPLPCRCRDVRTREVGIQDIHHKVKPEEVELVRRDYTANGGWETFLAYEDPRQDILIGLLRLRKLAGPEATRQPELKGHISMVGAPGGADAWVNGIPCAGVHFRVFH